MVVELRARAGDPVIAWCSMTTPCTTAFLPVPVGAPLPVSLTTGEGKPAAASAWWRLKRVEEWVDAQPEARSAMVRQHWAAWEAHLVDETRGHPGRASALLDARTAALLERADALLADPVTG